MYVQEEADAAPAALAQRQSWSVGGANVLTFSYLRSSTYASVMRTPTHHASAAGAACMFTEPGLKVCQQVSRGEFWVWDKSSSETGLNSLKVIRAAFQSWLLPFPEDFWPHNHDDVTSRENSGSVGSGNA